MGDATRTVGERGQVTIPKGLREKSNIDGGDRVTVREYAGGVPIRREPTESELAEAYRANADRAGRATEEWEGVSREADEHL